MSQLPTRLNPHLAAVVEASRAFAAAEPGASAEVVRRRVDLLDVALEACPPTPRRKRRAVQRALSALSVAAPAAAAPSEGGEVSPHLEALRAIAELLADGVSKILLFRLSCLCRSVRSHELYAKSLPFIV